MSTVLPSKPPRNRSDFSALIASILADAIAFLDQDQAAAQICIEKANKLMLQRPAEAPNKGGFPPWQAKRLQNFIIENLTGSIRMEQTAALVKLSPSHFSRAFKVTFGENFSQYVIMQRLGLARHMMKTTSEPIGEIAAACGLADQAHLTRLFRRTYGVTPSAWRRLEPRNA
jgi:AraC-like DNA-binding protein